MGDVRRGFREATARDTLLPTPDLIGQPNQNFRNLCHVAKDAIPRGEDLFGITDGATDDISKQITPLFKERLQRRNRQTLDGGNRTFCYWRKGRRGKELGRLSGITLGGFTEKAEIWGPVK